MRRDSHCKRAGHATCNGRLPTHSVRTCINSTGFIGRAREIVLLCNIRADGNSDAKFLGAARIHAAFTIQDPTGYGSVFPSPRSYLPDLIKIGGYRWPGIHEEDSYCRNIIPPFLTSRKPPVRNVPVACTGNHPGVWVANLSAWDPSRPACMWIPRKGLTGTGYPPAYVPDSYPGATFHHLSQHISIR
jgi:hypothetical protein